MDKDTPTPRPQSIGWHGKLPARGDFLGRGLPRAWLRTWDDWLQRALARAGAQVESELLRERLLAMSPWSCIVLPSAAGQPIWSGVVIATADRVGRVFPLMLAEAHAERELDHAALARLGAHGLQIARCARESARTLPARDFEAAFTEWTAAPWPVTNGADADEFPPGSLETLRLRHPAARSFWWRLEPLPDDLQVLPQPWPPHEALLLEWLAVPD